MIQLKLIELLSMEMDFSENSINCVIGPILKKFCLLCSLCIFALSLECGSYLQYIKIIFRKEPN